MISTLLVGFGFSAKTFHLPFLHALDAYQLDGVVSSRPDDVIASLGDVRVWPSLTQALAGAQFDLVIITTPNHLHASQTREALEADCNVLVEKPFTLTTVEARELVDLAADKNLDLTVFQNRRYDGDFLTLRAMLEKGMLGKIHRLESRFDRFRPHPRNRWRENAGPGSGITWDLGPHLIDQALVLFGMPDAVSADIRTLREGGQSDDTFDITLHYADLQVKLGSSPFQAGPTLRFDVQGDRGSYRKFHLDPQESRLREGVTPTTDAWAQTASDEHGVFYNESGRKKIETLQGAYLTFYQGLAASISESAVSPAPASEIVNVIQILEAARKAAQEATKVAMY